MEQSEQVVSSEISVALLGRDIKYIKQEVSEIKATLRVLLDHYVKREEFEARFQRFQEEIDGRFKGAHTRLDKVEECMVKKVEKEDLKPLKDLFWSVLTWAVIGTIGLIFSVASAVIYLKK